MDVVCYILYFLGATAFFSLLIYVFSESDKGISLFDLFIFLGASVVMWWALLFIVISCAVIIYIQDRLDKVDSSAVVRLKEFASKVCYYVFEKPIIKR